MIESQKNSLWMGIKSAITEPIEQLVPALKDIIDEFVSLPLIHKWTSLLVILYLAIPPLMYNDDPVTFHIIKLNTMYITISLLTLTVLFGYRHFPYLSLNWNLFKRERWLVLIAFFFMLFSLAINFPQMNMFVRAEVVSTPVFYGAGPNFISIFYYWLAFLVFFVGPVIYPHLPKKLITSLILLSLFITGALISYQILVDDFMGVARTYLFGFGNSNYTPDAFAIFGIYLLIPLLYQKKINVYSTTLGIFFFVVVLLSISRAAWVALAIAVLGAIIYLIISKHVEWKRLGILTGLGLGVIGLLVVVLVGLGESVILDDFASLLEVFSSDSDLAAISSLRTPLWASAIEMWLYGVADGTEVFGLNFVTIIFGNGQSVYLWVDAGTQYLVTNVHQMFFDVLMSAGIVVFALFIYFLYLQFKYVFVLLSQDIKHLSLFSALLFIMGKWLFNSLNGLHAPFVYTVPVLIFTYYSLSQDLKKAK
jgi:O-antigen ligase